MLTSMMAFNEYMRITNFYPSLFSTRKTDHKSDSAETTRSTNSTALFFAYYGRFGLQ